MRSCARCTAHWLREDPPSLQLRCTEHESRGRLAALVACAPRLLTALAALGAWAISRGDRVLQKPSRCAAPPESRPTVRRAAPIACRTPGLAASCGRGPLRGRAGRHQQVRNVAVHAHESDPGREAMGARTSRAAAGGQGLSAPRDDAPTGPRGLRTPRRATRGVFFSSRNPLVDAGASKSCSMRCRQRNLRTTANS